MKLSNSSFRKSFIGRHQGGQVLMGAVFILAVLVIAIPVAVYVQAQGGRLGNHAIKVQEAKMAAQQGGGHRS